MQHTDAYDPYRIFTLRNHFSFAAAAATVIHRCNPIIINLISNFSERVERSEGKIAERDNKRVFSILFFE